MIIIDVLFIVESQIFDYLLVFDFGEDLIIFYLNCLLFDEASFFDIFIGQTL